MKISRQQSDTPTAPKVVTRVLGHLPRYPGSFLFVSALNLVLARHLGDDMLQQIEGRTLCVEVLDVGLRFDYQWTRGAFRVVTRMDCEPDVTFAATAWDFYILLQRKEDPDTLFFSRRLMISGDTELGLLLKNTLDAIDMQVFHPSFILGDLLKSVRTRLGTGTVARSSTPL